MKHCHTDYFGSGTVGERGQIVIPAEAREKLKISAGDKFVFFGHGKVLHLMKAEEMDSILDRIHQRFEDKVEKINNKIKKISSEEEA